MVRKKGEIFTIELFVACCSLQNSADDSKYLAVLTIVSIISWLLLPIATDQFLLADRELILVTLL
ncbi:hypothetical protein BDW67DRAFT_161918 [Aspergillus spinulosporus]